MTDQNDEPFWKTKKLGEMSREEWESLCDGCARCCLIKLEDEDDGQLYHTSLSCQLLDTSSCRCTDYENRHTTVPDCVNFTHDKIDKTFWLPKTCAYRLLYEGKNLPDWHPLVSGNPETVHEAGISIRAFAKNEKEVGLDYYYKYIIDDDMHL